MVATIVASRPESSPTEQLETTATAGIDAILPLMNGGEQKCKKGHYTE
jgi:hypothetical protein